MMIFRFFHNGILMRRHSAEKSYVPYLPTAMIILVFFIYAIIFTPEYLKISNLALIANQAVITAIASCGIALIMAAGDFDLSIGAVIAVSNMVCAFILHHTGLIPLSVLLTLAAGSLMGLLNGFLVGIKRLPSFYITIATQIGFEGIAYAMGNGTSIYRSTQMQPFAQKSFLGLSSCIWIALVLALLLQFFLDNTILGRYLLATGHKHSVARAAGINVRKVIFLNYIIVGVIASIAGILYTAKIGYGYPDASGEYAYDAIVANLIGGNRFSGGKSSVLRAFFGSFIWVILQTFMGYTNMPYFYQRVIKCGIIIIALLMDQRLQEKVRNMAD